jgi:hypothetical protein
MRQAVGGLLAIAFAATFVQSPWLHVHDSASSSDHYRNEHVGLGALHGHGHAADGPEWADPESRGDAHFLGPMKGVRTAGYSALPFVGGAVPAISEPVLDPTRRQAELSPKAHGPPDLSSLPPRAPPA